MPEEPKRDPNTEVREQLQALREQVSVQAVRTEYLQKYYDLATQIQQLRLDVDAKWATFKAAGSIGALVITLLGLIGYRSLQDLRSEAVAEVRKNVEDTKGFYDDLMSGAALDAQRNYGAAVPRLMHCFKSGHQYDKSVLLPLLSDLNMTDNWEEAVPVVIKLRSDASSFDSINDAAVYTIVGSILVQSGLSSWVHDPTPDAARKSMDDGAAILKGAVGIIPPKTFATRMHAYNNLWIYYIALRQFDTSQTYIDGLKQLPTDERVYSWNSMRMWRCMRDLKEKDTEAFARAEAQWGQLASRYRVGG